MRKQLLAFVLVIVTVLQGSAQCGPCESLVNRIYNGDFEDGNTGFTTSFNYVTFFPFLCTLCPENNYAIGNNATLFHNGFAGTDHTNPPSGDFFIANAPGQNGAVVWCQTVEVLPQTDYTFTFWAQDIADNNDPHPLAKLRPSFNGTVSTDSLVAEGDWSSFSMSWFSDTLVQVEICILNYQTETGGNDFGLDDISLTACEPIELSQNAFAGNDTTICSRDAISLGVIPINGYSYVWSADEGVSDYTIGNPVFEIENISGNTVEYTLTVTRDSADVGCLASDTVTITVLSMQNFSLSDDFTICPGDSAIVNSPGVWDSIAWSTGDTSASITVLPGMYIATVFSGICSETDTLNVLEYSLPETDLPIEINHCNSEPLLLEAAVDGEWFSNGIGFDNPITISESGIYTFQYSDVNCSDIDTVAVVMYDQLFANLNSDTILCNGTTASLNSDQPGSWNTGEFGNSITVDEPGVYSIIITNGPCITSDTVAVIGLTVPQLFLGPDTTFCEDYPITLDAWNDGAVYQWSTGDTTASIITSGSGLYSVDVSNECGTSTDEILISNYPCSWAIHIPTCFTPNEDTFNESWGVSGYNIKAIDLTIYNRFGDAIFHSDTLERLWTPSSRVGDDIYNYRIEVTPFEGTAEVRTGVIYLIR
jgi:gliding motility-associated-like protein